MKISNCFMLAAYNLFRRKKTSFQVLFGITIILTLFMCSFFYITTLDNNLNDIVQNKISECSVNITFSNFANSKDLKDADYMSARIKKINEITGAIVRIDEKKISSISTSKLEIGRQIFNGNDDKSFTFESEYLPDLYTDLSVDLCLEYISLRGDQFSYNEFAEFDAKFKNDSIFSYGNKMTDEKQFMISDYLLKKYGIKEEQFPSLINKKISIGYQKNNEFVYVIKEYVLSGIIKEDFFRVSSRALRPQIITSILSYEPGDRLNQCEITAFVDEFNDLHNVYEKVSKFSKSEVTYKRSSYFIYSELSKQQFLSRYIFMTVGTIIFIALLLSIINIFLYNIIQKRTYFGMLKSNGMTDLEVFLVFWFEILLISLFGLAVSAANSFVFIISMNNILPSLVYTQIEVDFIYFSKILLLTLIFSVIICVIVALCNWFYIRKNSICKLLLN